MRRGACPLPRPIPRPVELLVMTSSTGSETARPSLTATARISMMALALAQVVIVGACNSNGESPTAPTSGESFRLEDFVASASVGGSQGQLRSGPAPTTGGGPELTVSGNQVVVNGGVTDLNVVAVSPISRIFVTLAGENFGLTTSASGLGDRYEVDLAAPETSADLLLTFPQNLPIEKFDVFFAAADESGIVGPLTRLTFDVLQVGTGDVQVTLGWDTVADVDLHVIDPNGDEVYWANRMVPSGGELDLDSNAGCSEGVSNENITWPEGLAPRAPTLFGSTTGVIVRSDRPTTPCSSTTAGTSRCFLAPSKEAAMAAELGAGSISRRSNGPLDRPQPPVLGHLAHRLSG